MHALPRATARACALPACVAALLLAAAAPALAGTIRYQIPPGPSYTVDNDHGIAKVTFDTCATAGQPQTLAFSVITDATGKSSGPAAFKVLRADGSIAFDPSTLTLAPGTQRTDVVATLTPPSSPGNGAVYRFKFAPSPGLGLGEGPGVMVRIACVLAAGPSGCPAAAPTRNPNDGKDGNPADGDAGAGNDGRTPPATCQPSVASCPATARAAQNQAPGNGNGNAHGLANGNGPGNANGNGNANGQANGNPHGNPNDGKDGDPSDGNAGRGNDQPAPVAAPGPACVTTAVVSAPTSGVFLPLGATASHHAAACVASAQRIRLRAGDHAIVTVRVRRSGVGIRGAAVRVSGLGVHATALTGAHGVARLRVAPRRRGRLKVQSDTCFGVDRLLVRAAKSGSVARTPAFTG